MEQSGRIEEVGRSERRIALLRLLVIAANAVLLSFYGDDLPSRPSLAWTILGIGAAYTAFTWFAFARIGRTRPGRGWLISLTDGVFLLSFVYATGIGSSPFHVALYPAVVSLAVRCSFKETLVLSALYALGYVGMLASAGELSENAAQAAVRVTYLGLSAVLGLFVVKAVSGPTARAGRLEEELRAAEELARKEALLAQAQRIAQLGSWEFDVQTKTDWWSEELYRIYGVPRETTPSFELVLSLVHPADAPNMRKGLARALQERGTFESEYRITRDGEERILHGRGTVLVDAAGEPIRVVGTVQDITGRKAAEAVQLNYVRERAARAAAEEAIRARDDFLSIASHELRTPLTSLKLQVELLRRQGSSAPVEALMQKVEIIERQGRRLHALIDGLLDVNRITSGELSLHLERIDFAQLLAEVVERYEPELSRSGSELSVLAGGPVKGCWDRRRLEQVVSHLLGNAIKYGQGRAIELSLEGAGDLARLTVTDLGMGIPAEDQQRIFERFERAVPARHFGGLGLGLWVARAVIEAMGGTIRVNSVVGRGSSFVVELPLAGPAPSHPKTQQQGAAS